MILRQEKKTNNNTKKTHQKDQKQKDDFETKRDKEKNTRKIQV